ncbi:MULTISPECIES: ADP-ribosyltransferase domain-containing protein [unclassified Nocardia]|uniref:ADP-ribosyltransferase domain-containing protein n=1 Tax=unclassified Nocardia TaxID=2637762 RepID=UPI001CE41D9E|nr:MULTISPECIES: ADP-ribosyltransferase domain-containing protein [unclassified Nocardia]
MKANGNRRLNRLARSKVVAFLKEQGLVETAAAVQAAPPSLLAELMSGLGIDPKILGNTPMPSTHANPPSAKLLIAQALAEREKLAAPKLSPAQVALNNAEDNLAAAEADAAAAVKRVNSAKYQLTKAKSKAKADPDAGKDAEVVARQANLEAAKQGHAAALQQVERARDDVAAAKFGLAADMAAEERDAYYASLTEDDIEAITRSVNRGYAEQATDALGAGGTPAISKTSRDTKIYEHAKIPMETGNGTVIVEGRKLDGGTAIYRRGSGDFVVLQRKGDAYHPITTAGGKSQALDRANRIPIMTGLGELPADATDMQRQAYEIKADLMLQVATKAANGTANSPAAQQKIIDDGMTGAATKLADSVGGGVVRADIYDGTKRHKKAMREKAAHEAGEKARAAALASGATKAQADAAYAAARRKSLGTPTRGGGVIPHFDHKIPPDSIGAEKHASLTRSGIRAWGAETADDYAIIAKRGGDLKAWGFTDNTGEVKTSNIAALTKDNAEFVGKVLSGKERSAFTTYTGGSYMAINAAITGRDTNPSPYTKSVVAQLQSGFDKFRAHNTNMKPMTLMRGSRVPSGWKGTPEEYLEAAFKPGSRVEIGKVTSCSTRKQTALNFCTHPPYMLVIRTRDGLPVKSISQFSGEDEVIVPPGTHLRCVRIDKNGIGGKPTVYLVAEDLVAEEEETTFAVAA